MINLDQIEERDIDFLVMRLFMEQPRFAALSLSKAGWERAQVVRVEHSLTDPALGESDITIIIALDGKRHGLLIEGKIDAPAMRLHCQRYYERGNIGVTNGNYDDFAVFLIAPQSYLDDNEEAQNYENRISYEEMRTTLQALGASFDCAILERVVAKKASGYVLREVPCHHPILAGVLRLLPCQRKGRRDVCTLRCEGHRLHMAAISNAASWNCAVL